MTENKKDQNLAQIISRSTKRDDFAKKIEDALVSDEIINLGFKPNEAAEKVVDALSYMGVFASQPATFDIEAFKFTGGFDLDDEAADTVWNFLKRTGIFVDESNVAPGRVSLEQKTIDMLKDLSNGFLTED